MDRYMFTVEDLKVIREIECIIEKDRRSQNIEMIDFSGENLEKQYEDYDLWIFDF